jgi:hypothetical protein
MSKVDDQTRLETAEPSIPATVARALSDDAAEIVVLTTRAFSWSSAGCIAHALKLAERLATVAAEHGLAALHDKALRIHGLLNANYPRSYHGCPNSPPFFQLRSGETEKAKQYAAMIAEEAALALLRCELAPEEEAELFKRLTLLLGWSAERCVTTTGRNRDEIKAILARLP